MQLIKVYKPTDEFRELAEARTCDILEDQGFQVGTFFLMVEQREDEGSELAYAIMHVNWKGFNLAGLTEGYCGLEFNVERVWWDVTPEEAESKINKFLEHIECLPVGSDTLSARWEYF